MLLRTLSVVMVALVGCGGEAADHGDPGAIDASTGQLDGGAADASNGADAGGAKLTLRVTEAAQRQLVAFTAPAFGNRWVSVTLSLANTGETRPLPVDPSAFALEADSLLYAESPISARADMPCPAAVAIENGGTLSCRAVFELPWTSSVNRLVYDDTMGRNTAAVIDTVAPPVVLCKGWGRSSNCDFCLENLSSFCSDDSMNSACAEELTRQCVKTATCPEVATGCEPSVACAIALDAYQSCVADRCLSSCT